MINLRRLIIVVIILVLGFSGWIVLANLVFKQTDCIYRPEGKYIWIKLNNGVLHKGVRFVSDAVIFDSAVFGKSSASEYGSIIRLKFRDELQGFGNLSIERNTPDGIIKIIKIGLVDNQCWSSLKELVAANPESRHIELVEDKQEK